MKKIFFLFTSALVYSAVALASDGDVMGTEIAGRSPACYSKTSGFLLGSSTADLILELFVPYNGLYVGVSPMRGSVSETNNKITYEGIGAYGDNLILELDPNSYDKRTNTIKGLFAGSFFTKSSHVINEYHTDRPTFEKNEVSCCYQTTKRCVLNGILIEQ